MGSLNPTAASSSSGDWRHQLNPNARTRMCSTMLQTLKRYLPVEEVRRRNIATQIEKQCYIASANQSDYFKNIAAVINHVEKQYKYRHPTPSLPQQSSNPALSSASILMSQQQSQQPDNSTLVQTFSLSSDDQSLTSDSQASVLHNTFGQSTIGQMHQMAMQSATQIGIRHNPLDAVQQPVNQQQQHPEPSMNQQFSVQQIERTQQSLQQPATGELSNLHPNQLNNLLNHYQTQVPMLSQPQHLNYTSSYNEDGNWDDIQSLLEFSEVDTFLISEYIHDPEMNSGDEKDGCFDSPGLAAMEVPNSLANPKKRKCDGSSYSAPMLNVDDRSSVGVSASLANP